VRGGLLVTEIHDPDAFVLTSVVDGRDMPPGQREEVRYPFSLQDCGDQVPAVTWLIHPLALLSSAAGASYVSRGRQAAMLASSRLRAAFAPPAGDPVAYA
jgi:hypothetical protein